MRDQHWDMTQGSAVLGGKAHGRIWAGTWNGCHVWDFTPAQVWDPNEVTECLKRACPGPGYPKETQVVALFGDLACAYRALFMTIYTLKEKRGSLDLKTHKQTLWLNWRPAPNYIRCP